MTSTEKTRRSAESFACASATKSYREEPRVGDKKKTNHRARCWEGTTTLGKEMLKAVIRQTLCK